MQPFCCTLCPSRKCKTNLSKVKQGWHFGAKKQTNKRITRLFKSCVYHSSWLARRVHEDTFWPHINERDGCPCVSLATQHPHQPGQPRENAGGNSGLLYRQWRQRSEEVIRPAATLTACRALRADWRLLNAVHASLLEHFSTAKLVTTTSQTQSGSRSAAASDVSSCAFACFGPRRGPAPSPTSSYPRSYMQAHLSVSLYLMFKLMFLPLILSSSLLGCDTRHTNLPEKHDCQNMNLKMIFHDICYGKIVHNVFCLWKQFTFIYSDTSASRVMLTSVLTMCSIRCTCSFTGSAAQTLFSGFCLSFENHAKNNRSQFVHCSSEDISCYTNACREGSVSFFSPADITLPLNRQRRMNTAWPVRRSHCQDTLARR